MARKIRLVEGNVFQSQQAFVRLEFNYFVDQQEWVSVRQNAEHLVDVHRYQSRLQRPEQRPDRDVVVVVTMNQPVDAGGSPPAGRQKGAPWAQTGISGRVFTRLSTRTSEIVVRVAVPGI